MKNTPNKIYLVVDDQENETPDDFDEIEDFEHVLWSTCQNFDTDLEYLSKDAVIEAVDNALAEYFVNPLSGVSDLIRSNILKQLEELK